jgi:hypothetical protein
MAGDIVVATISASASVGVAAVSYFFTKYRERENDWRKQKLQHYSELITATSGIVEGDVTAEAQRHFATTCNTIGLVASQKVIQRLNEFREALWIPPDPPDAHERKFRELILEIRRDLKISPEDDVSTFTYHLWASGVESQDLSAKATREMKGETASPPKRPKAAPKP